MKVMWIGEPGSADSTDTLGFHFPKGKWMEVPDNHPNRQKFINNPFFETDAPADKAQQHADDHNAKVAVEVEKEREKAAAADAKAKADEAAKEAKAVAKGK
jgi:hypothetical protein